MSAYAEAKRKNLDASMGTHRESLFSRVMDRTRKEISTAFGVQVACFLIGQSWTEQWQV